VPEPIQSVSSNSCEYDPTPEVSSAPPVAGPSIADNAHAPQVASEPAVELLVSKHPSTDGLRQCVSEKAALLVASGALIRSAGAMVVTAPTAIGEIPAITAFIASSIAVAATGAMYLNCEDDAKAASKPK
jgi:hypothetical protein